MANNFAAESSYTPTHYIVAESSSAPTRFMGSLQSNEQDEEWIPHDIFLSHSGKQKGFVKDLYADLRAQNFTTFLDIEYHSLPPGENFPDRIFKAASKCKLALVVLSHDFVCSVWPMRELSTFVDYMPSVKIIPLFYKLQPHDLNNKDNLERWRKVWKAFARKNPCIDVSKWVNALKILKSQGGFTLDAAKDGERNYLNKIVETICKSQVVVPAIVHDSSRIQGKDRLCKIILDKFKEMESCKQGALLQHDDLKAPESEVTCVLGVYGLPGSGKSTLCRCLRDYFSPIYGGKSLYLELPTNPSPVDLVKKFKELLRLTNFRNSLILDHGVTEFEQVVSLLEKYLFSRCKVFLVVDNISGESESFVQRILEVGIGPGSKVILVARTRDILRSFQGRTLYGFDSMCIPNINEEEASQILLQIAPMVLDGYAHCTPKQADSLLRIVRMCSFVEGKSLMYLPLVMQRMGVLLMKYDKDFEGWRSDQERFWTEVKQDAVQNLVKDSFEKLDPKQLQLLFLDVALFIVPSNFGELEVCEVCSVLSLLHGTSTLQIAKMVTDLERLCFLRVIKGFVSVHDVYLEFARGIQKGFMHWCWLNLKYSDAESPRALMLNGKETMIREQKQVRTMILEVGKGCMTVDLQGFSGLKAVVVRDGKSLEALGVAGLSSLVSLDIESCGCFQQLECRDQTYTSLLNLKRLRIEESTSRSSWLLPADMWEPFLDFLPPVKQQFHVGIARCMKGLQVLKLERTGIRRLVGLSSFWPHLQYVRIIEPCLDAFEVGNLPHLKSFIFSDHGVVAEGFTMPFYSGFHYKNEVNMNNKRWKLHGVNLLLGCSSLQEVSMACSSFEADNLGTLPPNLKILQLNCLYSATKLPNFTSSAHSLEELVLRYCEQVERVDLHVARFENLRKLVLHNCWRIFQVDGLHFLPSLHSLEVMNCWDLKSLVGFQNSRMLKSLVVESCSKLGEISSLSGLISLENVKIIDCPALPSLEGAAIDNLMNLKVLECPLKACQPAINLRKYGNLEKLHLVQSRAELDGEHFETSQPNLDVSLLLGLVPADDPNPSRCLPSINSLRLENMHDLACMDGIEHFRTLTKLWLESLKNLRSLQGIESLICLAHLSVHDAPLLEEVPSLHKLVNLLYLYIIDCPMLKAVEGCSEMRCLCTARFDGCERMAKFPLKGMMDRLRDLNHLGFLRCEFARNTEEMAEWVGDKEAPNPLWTASLCQLACQYYDDSLQSIDSRFPRLRHQTRKEWLADALSQRLHHRRKHRRHKRKGGVAKAFFQRLCHQRKVEALFKRKERVVEALFPRLLHRFLPNDDDCIDFEGLIEKCYDYSKVVLAEFPGAAMRLLEHRLEGKPKKELLQRFQTFKCSLLDFLNDAGATAFFSDAGTLKEFLDYHCIVAG